MESSCLTDDIDLVFSLLALNYGGNEELGLPLESFNVGLRMLGVVALTEDLETVMQQRSNPSAAVSAAEFSRMVQSLTDKSNIIERRIKKDLKTLLGSGADKEKIK